MKQAAVIATIVVPMIKTYHPPHHLKGKAESDISSAASDLYGEALKGFSRETLAKAWKQVVAEHKSWGWPAVGEITKVCRELSDSEAVVQYIGQDKKYAWDIAAEQAQKLRDEFMENAGNLPLSRQAKSEGWYFGLRGLYHFFDAHATMQAQVIAGMRNHRYSAWTVGYGTWIDDTNYNFNSDLAREKAQATQRGEIEILTAPEAVAWMKRQVAA